MMDITGATMMAAEAALTKSAPNLQPRFLVFRFLGPGPSVLTVGAAIANGLTSVDGLSWGISMFN